MALADKVSDAWIAFAKTGNPTVKGLIEWPAYTEQNDQYLHIGQTLQVKKGIKSSYVAPPGR